MRFLDLSLVRFGRFTDKVFDLSRPGMHILYGPNESGKSTTLRAVSYLLFGFPRSTRDDPLYDAFRHPPSQLEIGATLEGRDGQCLAVHRRKTSPRIDVLTDPRATPLDATQAALLERWLRGESRGWFELRFGLNNERLRDGGEQIRNAKGDVGLSLFQAAAGAADVRQAAEDLQAEAERLVGNPDQRRSSKRPFFQALDRLKEAERRIKADMLKAEDWKKRTAELEKTEAELQEVIEEYSRLTAAQSRRQRLQRVRPALRQLAEQQEALAALPPDLPNLPAEAVEHYRDARATRARTGDDCARLQEAIDTLTTAIEAHEVPEALLAEGEPIEALYQEAGQEQKGRRDKEKRAAEAEELETKIEALLAELGWLDTAAAAKEKGKGAEAPAAPLALARRRLPGKLQTGALERLLRAHDTLADRRRAQEKAVAECEANLAETEAALAALPPAPDPATRQALEECLKALQKYQDLRRQIAEAEAKAAQRRQQAGEALRALPLWSVPEADSPEAPSPSLSPSLSALAALAVPVSDTRARFRDAWAEATRERQRLEDKARETRDRLTEIETELATLEQAGPVPTPEAVEQARGQRNLFWSLLRRRHIDGQILSEGEEAQLATLAADFHHPGHPAPAFEQALHAADTLADRRESDARRIADYQRLLREQSEQEAKREALLSDLESANRAWEDLQASWRAAWPDLPAAPLPPAEMEAWLTQRKALLASLEESRSAEAEAAALSNQYHTAMDWLHPLLVAAGEEDLSPSAPLEALLQRAETMRGRWDTAEKERNTLESRLATLRQGRDKAQGDRDKGEQEWAAWEQEWRAALEAAGFDTDSAPALVGDLLAECARLRELLAEWEKAARALKVLAVDSQSFADRTVKAAEAAGLEDLIAADPLDTLTQLYTQLQHAKTARNARDRDRQSLQDLQEKQDQAQAAHRKAEAACLRWQEEAGCGPEATEEAVQARLQAALERRQRLEAIDTLLAGLSEAGDGKPLKALQEEEADAPDPDALREEEARDSARQQALQEKRDGLNRRIAELKTEIRTMETGPGAAAAAEDRQAALAQAHHVANRFIRYQVAARLLHLAIERFRDQSQGPLMDRASALFQELTAGRYEGLGTRLDANGDFVLQGVRVRSGTSPDLPPEVPVEGMSEGTRDQLYLALRLATLEQELERAEPLPFLADDLLVHFDDGRAAAALKTLQHFAEKTQVLFFTHHRHLVELAKENLGEDGYTLTHIGTELQED